MKEKIRKHLPWIIVTSLITLIPMFAGMALWNRLPEMLPTHFNMEGVVDGYGSRFDTVVMLPLFLLGIHLLCAFACMADPRNFREKAISDGIYRIILLIVPMVSVFVSVLTYGTAFGWKMNINMIVQLSLGILFIVIGLFIPRVEQNYTAGFRLPWTLDDKENWKKTNKLGGIMMIVCGLLWLVNAFLNIGGSRGFIIILVVNMVLMLIVPCIYSFMIFVKNKEGETL